MGCSGFKWVPVGFDGFQWVYWVPVGSSEFNLVPVFFFRLQWVLTGCSGF